MMSNCRTIPLEKNSVETGFDLSSISLPRLFVAACVVLFGVINCILLERRFVDVYRQSLSTSGFTACVLFAFLVCTVLKCIAESSSPSLTQRANLTLAALLSLEFTCFAWAIFPLTWNWTAGFILLSFLGMIAWFCISRTSVGLMHGIWERFVWRTVADFLVLPVSLPEPALSPDARETSASASQKRVVLDQKSPTSLTPSILTESIHPTPIQTDEDRELDASRNEGCLRFADYSSLADNEADVESTDLTSSMIRRIEMNGDDVVEVRAIAVFAAGARQAVLHIPFSPPFANVPKVECELSDDSPVRLKIAAVFPYGVRLELKRSESMVQELKVPLELFAVYAVSRFAT